MSDTEYGGNYLAGFLDDPVQSRVPPFEFMLKINQTTILVRNIDAKQSALKSYFAGFQKID